MEREIEMLSLRQCSPQELQELEVSAEQTRLDALQMLREIPDELRRKYEPTWLKVAVHAEVLRQACRLLLKSK